MRLQLGPLPSSNARAWIGYAREQIDDVAGDPFESRLDADVLASFERYLDAWEEEAQRGEEFCWETEVPSDVAEYQAHAFHQIADRLARAAEQRGEPLQPPEAEPFYQALVNAVIDGLMMEGDSAAEYAAHLRSFWPGYGDADVEVAADEV